MKNLYRNLGIGLGVAALTFSPFIHTTFAQDEATTKQVEEKQPVENKAEVEHLKRAGAQKETTEEKVTCEDPATCPKDPADCELAEQ